MNSRTPFVKALIMKCLLELGPTAEIGEKFEALDDIVYDYRLERSELSAALRELLFTNEISMGSGLQPVVENWDYDVSWLSLFPESSGVVWW